MSLFLRVTAIGAVVLAVLAAAAVEIVCRIKGDEWRVPLLWGCAAGFGLNVLGFPIMLKLAVMPAQDVKDGKALAWWVGGVLFRVVGIGALVYLARRKFGGHEDGLMLMAVLVYMAGMFGELAWLGRRLNEMDKR